MVKSHGDFVTIIDLPEGEHQYKYFVDGEWRHDPAVVIKFIILNLKNNSKVLFIPFGYILVYRYYLPPIHTIGQKLRILNCWLHLLLDTT